MPELPEVETVLRTLEKQLGQPNLLDIHIYYDKMIVTSDAQTFIRELKNEQIISYHRIGKYLIFGCKHHYLVVHLRMEGKFYIQEACAPKDKHIHVCIDLEDNRQLRYHDTRKFGRMYLYDKIDDFYQLPCFANVGKDAFDETLTSKDLYLASRKRTITLKQFLLSQDIMAGVGNIYADEICFACSLHPCTKACKLSKKDCENVLLQTRRILSGAIKAGGTSIRSYTSSLKVDGRFQLQLKVHDKKGQVCPRCGSIIEKKQVAGRGTSYCKACQKRK